MPQSPFIAAMPGRVSQDLPRVHAIIAGVAWRTRNQPGTAENSLTQCKHRQQQEPHTEESHSLHGCSAAALFATLEADAKGPPSQARSTALADLAAYAAPPGCWHQHGSHHGLVQWSSRQYISASVLACASAKISSQDKTEILRVSAADQWQPGAPTPSSAARGATLWWLAMRCHRWLAMR